MSNLMPNADAAPALTRRSWLGRQLSAFTALREEAPLWQYLAFGALCVALVFFLWWYVTSAPIPEERIISPVILPSPAETFGELYSLWFEHFLVYNTYLSLRRLVLGFGMAALIGVPLGVLCGCFTRVQAFFAPLMLFGRNVPIAALVGLTYVIFGLDEQQKIMFIFIACLAFIMSDTARAIQDVGGQYVDTAYTLGASRRQIITKVLVPLAMPSVFNSLRLLFGLAFGYITLAEMIRIPGAPGLGGLIDISMGRGGKRENLYLILLLIPLVAFAIDRFLFWVQKELFPFRYGGVGVLNQALCAITHGWEDCWHAVAGLFRRRQTPAADPGAPAGAPAKPDGE